MSDYDYGNARLRAMKSRLLLRREFESLVESGSLQGLIAGLSKTSYRKPVEAALARATGIDCISIALRDDLVTIMGKIPRFYSGQAREMVAIVLRAYDIENLKAILHGVSKQAPPAEIHSAIIPVGELSYEILAELTRASEPRLVIDLLASMALPFAQPLLRLRVERPGAGTLEMEIRLDQWYYREAFDCLKKEQRMEGVLYLALQLESDLDNLLTMLRFVHAPEERAILRDWLDSDDLNLLFVGPGKLSFDLLTRAGNQETVPAAVELLAGTAYEPSLRNGLSAYASTGRLSEFEKQLRRFRLERMSALISKDPLGIGAVLGYLALKINEISNIRWIAHAINLGLASNSIRSELVYIG